MKWCITFIIAVIMVSMPFSVREVESGDGAGDDFDEISHNESREIELWFKRGEICFGHYSYGELFCTAPYRESKSEYERLHVKNYPAKPMRGEESHSFSSYPDSNLSRYFSSVPGDTVLIIWKNGTNRAIITGIGDYISVCVEGLRCRLELMDSTEVLPKGNFLVLMGELANYNGPIIPYTEYQPYDNDLIAIRDSLRNELDSVYNNFLIERLRENHPESDNLEIEMLLHDQWTEIDKYNSTRDRINTLIQGKKQSALPDTLFLSNQCWYLGTESWAANYLLIRENHRWCIHTLKEPGLGSGHSQIYCTLDLNGDGIVEYLNSGFSVGLWMFFDGEIMQLKSSDYWGC